MRITSSAFAPGIAAIFGLSVLACANPAPEPSGRSTSAIINGTRERGLPEVVAVVQVSGGSIVGICSGTAIADRVVVTAKHCVYDTGGGAAIPTSALRVLVTDNVSGTISVQAQVSAVSSTPGPLTDDDLVNGRDIAVLRVDRSLGVTPRQVARAAPTAGNPITIVGFGRTSVSSGSSGVKYRGEAQVSDSYPPNNLFETAGISRTCQGDSGGPAFDANGRLIGVTSFGVDRSCREDRSFFTMTVGNLSIIEAVLGGAAPCTAATETCNGADDNCDGVVDEGCNPLGSECFRAEECSTGRCENIAGTFRCVSGCDPDATDACPTGFICEVRGCDNSRCVAGTLGATPNGSPCEGNFDCQSNFCWTRTSDGASVCAQFCRDGGAPCADGFACELGIGGGCGACLETEAPPLLSFGATCTSDAECASGTCATGAGDFCTQSCADHEGCPGAFHCADRVCAEGAPYPAGSACDSSARCSDAAPECAEHEGASICVSACDAAGCASGFECAATSVGDRCVPEAAPPPPPPSRGGCAVSQGSQGVSPAQGSREGGPVALAFFGLAGLGLVLARRRTRGRYHRR